MRMLIIAMIAVIVFSVPTCETAGANTQPVVTRRYVDDLGWYVEERADGSTLRRWEGRGLKIKTYLVVGGL